MTAQPKRCELRGYFVIYLRLKRNMLQYHLAEKSGIGVAELSNVETGQNITVETEEKIARALDMERWQLAKVPENIMKRLPWMQRKEYELKRQARGLRKHKGLTGQIPLAMWEKELPRIKSK